MGTAVSPLVLHGVFAWEHPVRSVKHVQGVLAYVEFIDEDVAHVKSIDEDVRA